ncbi:DUF3027 domain-containing protein [Microbacterium halotolerans]|uniref:DUF3027 domain-containing protein n=1 Tax=Microbacterium halotolerans TaxID=246613 RepID=UPI00308425B4
MPESQDEAAEVPDAQQDELSGPDARLIAAHDLALTALHEITPAESIGVAAGHRTEQDGIVSLLFENRLLGYPGWYWTVSLAVVQGAEPTVLEAELLPGDDALIAPEWVPWSVRLKEYQAQQRAAAEEEAARAEAQGDDETTFDEFDPDDDDDDFSEDGSPILHAGDVDGVDIDELDAGGEEDEPDDEEADDDDPEDDVDSEDGDDAETSR